MAKELSVRELNFLHRKFYQLVVTEPKFSEAASYSILSTFAGHALPITMQWPASPHAHALFMDHDQNKLPETRDDFRKMMKNVASTILTELEVGAYASPQAGSLLYNPENVRAIETIFEKTLLAMNTPSKSSSSHAR